MKLTPEQVERVRSLEDDLRRVTPDRVVDDAKNPESPLHPLFEWNKAKAAAAHWVDQAREIIGSVTLLVTNETFTYKAPAYPRDPDVKGQGYRHVSALRAEPDQARRSLIYTLEVAAGHVRRAHELAEPLGLSGEIDGLLDQIVGVQRSIRTAA